MIRKVLLAAFTLWISTGSLILGTPESAKAVSVSVFNTDFSSGAPSEFSGITTTEAVQGYAGLGTGANVFGDNFLRNSTGGDGIGNPDPTTIQSTGFTLTGLQAHTSIDINFLLAIIDSWDGTIPGCCSNIVPDFFEVRVDGTTIFSESFGFIGQTFVPTAGVLLAEFTSLGFNSGFGDAAYNMGLFPAFNSIAHTASALTIEMTASGSGFQGGDDESWAIDNFEIISNDVIPEPSTLLLLGSGLAGLAVWRRMKAA